MRTAQSPEDTLREWATHLDGIRTPGSREPFVDAMSDALVWPDETDSSTPMEVIWALRFVRHYRTGLILGEARPHAEFWQLARELFPHWVGFLPSRCELSPRLAEIYHASRKRGKDGSHTTA
jgi:hypothetical protein